MISQFRPDCTDWGESSRITGSERKNKARQDINYSDYNLYAIRRMMYVLKEFTASKLQIYTHGERVDV